MSALLASFAAARQPPARNETTSFLIEQTFLLVFLLPNCAPKFSWLRRNRRRVRLHFSIVFIRLSLSAEVQRRCSLPRSTGRSCRESAALENPSLPPGVQFQALPLTPSSFSPLLVSRVFRADGFFPCSPAARLSLVACPQCRPHAGFCLSPAFFLPKAHAGRPEPILLWCPSHVSRSAERASIALDLASFFLRPPPPTRLA